MHRLADLLALLCTFVAGVLVVLAPAQAQTVTLRSADGSLSLRGDLKAFDGETYILETAVGPIPISAAGVFCDGEACPAPAVEASVFRILASRGLEQGLVLSLLESYSLDIDTDIEIRPLGPQKTEVKLINFDGTPAVTIAIEPAETGRAFEGLAISEATIALTNRPIDAGEIQLISALGHGDPTSARSQSVAALDGVVFVTAPDNPLGAITEDQIAALLSGQIRDWSEMGGTPGPVNLYLPSEETGTQAVLQDLILEPSGLTFSRNAAILPTDAQVADRVTTDPFGFGVTTYSNLRSTTPLLVAGSCGFWSAPSPFAIKAEEYPYTKRIFLYRSGREVPDAVERFLTYLASDPAQEVIRDAGYVDQRVSSVDITGQGLRFATAIRPSSGAEVSLEQLQSLIEEVIAAQRLSMTLRFEAGTVGFDARASADLKRLAEMIVAGRFEGQEILLLGFTDSLGRGADNRELSDARAEAAEAALRALLPPEFATTAPIFSRGFGELSPLACDTTADGQRINRRVEVWTRPALR
ncbi:MAG: substrate-binding domain-containing protein [Pseudomonadota bacterium]